MQLVTFTRNCRIKNLNDFERDEADAYLWGAGLSNVKEKGMSICYTINSCLEIFLREGKVNVGDLEITLQMAHQTKLKVLMLYQQKTLLASV